MGFDGDNFSMYSKWFDKKICINSKRQFCTDCRAPLPSRNIFLFSRRGSSQVGGNTYTVMGQQMHRPLQLITQRFAKCLQNFVRRLKTVERSSQSTPSFLRSQSEVAGYMGGRLQVSDKSHRPPGLPLNYWSTSILYFCLISVAVARLPWKDDLIDTNKLFVPNLENLANIVGTAGNLARAVKRPGDGGGGAGPGEEKRACPEPLPLFPL